MSSRSVVNLTNDDEFRQVGRVLRPHGVRGEFIVYIESDFPNWLAKRKSFYVPGDKGMVLWQVLSARFSGKKLLLKVDALPDRTAVEAARDTPLFLPDQEARQATDDPDFFYNSDLVGCEVFDTREQKVIGTVRAVVEMPAQNLLEVVEGQGPAVLIPFINPIVGDIQAGRIEVNLPEGLLECYLEDDHQDLSDGTGLPSKAP